MVAFLHALQTYIDINRINDGIEHVEYPCIKPFFSIHSKYFPAICYDNGNTDINSKLKLNDIDCNTFEFIRGWCYPNKSPMFINKFEAFYESIISTIIVMEFIH